tara:strand:- start:249 stop:476 length:228 start_codon:yes stop_codon:yes gene_type:complete
MLSLFSFKEIIMAKASIFILNNKQLQELKAQLEVMISQNQTIVDDVKIDEFDKAVAWSLIYESRNDLDVIDKILF